MNESKPWPWPWQQPDSSAVLVWPYSETLWYISEPPVSDDTTTAEDAYLYACLLWEAERDAD